jgi:glycosyltransferase involved in cell wall biosynthesis
MGRVVGAASQGKEEEAQVKILLVGLSSDGHRKQYLEYIAAVVNQQNQAVLLCPAACADDFNVPCKRVMRSGFEEKRTWKRYVQMLFQIRKAASEEGADIIHFLEADEIYRYFGLGLGMFSKFRMVMTFHHLYTENWRNLAIKSIMSKIDCSVVHTKMLAEFYSSQLKRSFIKQIEYPVFDYEELLKISPVTAKKEYSLPLDKKVIGLLGGTLRYKGYHFLLENLQYLKREGIYFLFAGNERDYTHSQIETALKENHVEGTVILRRLTSYEFRCAIQASDIILLPYGREFNGASGPLAEGVCAGKTIIGSDHGSLGSLIRDNHIGYTFETENGQDLIRVLNQVKEKDFLYDKTAEEYRKSLQPEFFGEAYLKVYRKLLS